MAYLQLNSFMGWNKRNLPEGLVSICDCLERDGGFLLHHFVHHYLKSGYKVVVVGLDKSYQHYTTVGRKMVCFGVWLMC